MIRALVAACGLIMLVSSPAFAEDIILLQSGRYAPLNSHVQKSWIPDSIKGRYPLPSEFGTRDRIPVGAYYPVPEDQFTFAVAPGSAAVGKVVKVSSVKYKKTYRKHRVKKRYVSNCGCRIR